MNVEVCTNPVCQHVQEDLFVCPDCGATICSLCGNDTAEKLMKWTGEEWVVPTPEEIKE